jgi:hypothetical protein
MATRQFRLYEDCTLIITTGRMTYRGFSPCDENGSQMGKQVKTFATNEQAEGYINCIPNLRWCDDYDQHETMYFRTWYQN